MANWSPDLIGIPPQYRNVNPYGLSVDQMVDAYPKAANPKYVDRWIELLVNGRDEASSTPRLAWAELVADYTGMVRTLGDVPWVTLPDARNVNAHALGFLNIRRRRVVNWVDRMGLLRDKNILHANHIYLRKPNSFCIRSHVAFRPIADGIKIGERLQNHKFFRHAVGFARGNTWQRWLEFGVIRLLWAAQGGTDAQLFIEYHIPYLPQLQIIDNDIDDRAFHELVDAHIWIPAVKANRFKSSANPKIWRF